MNGKVVEIKKLLLAITLFVVLRSFLDYAVCMWALESVGPYWNYYAQFLCWSGLSIPLFLWKWKPQYILLGGLSVFLAENFFYVWVSLIGNLNGCYDWYIGNPLNPDGNWGYGWTNPQPMVPFFCNIMFNYLIIVVVVLSAKFILKALNKWIKKRK